MASLCNVHVLLYLQSKDFRLNGSIFLSFNLLTFKIDVYECVVGTSPIMRRCKDDWVNATQILKLCDFPKAKRTKILEKGVQCGKHEKIQGGYGRFQGTWIPLEDARALAKEYDISPELLPVLFIDTSDPNLIIPKRLKPGVSSTAKGTTPVKRKMTKRTPKETPKKLKVDETPSQNVYVPDYYPPMGAPQHQHPGDSSGILAQGPSLIHNPSANQHNYSQMSGVNDNLSADNSFKSYDNYQVQAGPGFVPHQQMLLRLQPQNHLIQNQNYDTLMNSSGIDHMGQRQPIYSSNVNSALSNGTNETYWSQEDPNRESDTSLSSADAKNTMGFQEPTFAAQMLRYFSEDNFPIPSFIYNHTPGFDINDSIDDEGHTSLHWAASIGDLNLVLLVLSKGANPLVVSNYGMNPLSKCITFNNCYDLGNFQNILNALEACLIHTDINGRTPLHYVCQFSKVRSKLPSLLHYTERMFSKIINIAGQGTTNGLDLFRNVLNHQDINGDTCLHLAARSGCTEIFQYFLTHGARDDLPNGVSETSKTLMLQSMPSAYDFNPNEIVTVFNQATAVPPKSNTSHVNNFSLLGPAPTYVSSVNGLGTPIQPRQTSTVTPDTQRTTVQDDDDEEVNDCVTKEHLQSLIEDSTVTIEDNKENIFFEDSKKQNYGAMSTPKQPKILDSGIKLLITDKKTLATLSPLKDYLPNPPKINGKGQLIDKVKVTPLSQPQLNIPIQDVASMLHGMVNSFASSCDQELRALSEEQLRVRISLEKTRREEIDLTKGVRALMKRNDLTEVTSLDEATRETQASINAYEKHLRDKEKQLSFFMEKYQSNQLEALIDSHRSSASHLLESEDQSIKLELMISISKAQLKRRQLVKGLLSSMKTYAIGSNMNKYRKLISLSCGLRVEDIDSLIDGIQESLSDGTT